MLSKGAATPQSSDVEALALSVTAFGKRAFKVVIQVTRGHGVGP